MHSGWRRHGLFFFGHGFERSRNEADTAEEKDQHDQGVKQRRWPEKDVEAKQDSNEDNRETRHSEDPSGKRLAVKEQKSDTKNEWNQGKAEGVHAIIDYRQQDAGGEEFAGDGDLIGQEPTACGGHG